jgi:hypothetical protein
MLRPTSRFSCCVADIVPDQKDQSPDRFLLGIGALCVAAGLYFGLIGLGLVRPPSKVNGPLWLVLCAGLVFAAGGLTVIVRGALGMDDKQQDLPANAPQWLKVMCWLAGLTVAAGLALIGTWIAFGPGEREFTMSATISGPIGGGVGRVMFGIGAIMTWLMVIAFARHGARKLFGKKI